LEELMIPQMTPIERCREVAGLRPHEIVLGVSPGETHERMLARYRRARSRSVARVRIVEQIRAAIGKGAARRAADLLIVLRRLMARDPRPEGVAPASRSSRRRAASPRRRLGALHPAVDLKAAPSALAGGRIIVLPTVRRPE
jgi:hypothetical protein